MMSEKRKDFSLASYQYLPPKLQDQASIRDQVELNQKDIDGGLPWRPSGLPLCLRPYRVGLQCERSGFYAWVGKIPWRRK